MRQYLTIFLAGVLLSLAVGVSYHIGYKQGQKLPIIARVDTLTIYKEKTSYKPKEITALIYTPIPIPKVIFRSDTVVRLVVDSVNVTLPIEHKVYRQDGEYEVGISGVTPTLDYVKTFTRESVLTKEVSVPAKRKWNIGVQVGVGPTYGLIGKRWDVGPYIGVGVEYNF